MPRPQSIEARVAAILRDAAEEELGVRDTAAAVIDLVQRDAVARFGDLARWDELNAFGPRLFGTNLIAANELAASVLDSFGIRPQDGRALGGAIALQVAFAAREGKIPTNTARAVEQVAARMAKRAHLAPHDASSCDGCTAPAECGELGRCALDAVGYPKGGA